MTIRGRSTLISGIAIEGIMMRCPPIVPGRRIIGSLLFILGGAFSLKVVTPSAVSFMLSYARPGLRYYVDGGRGSVEFTRAESPSVHVARRELDFGGSSFGAARPPSFPGRVYSARIARRCEDRQPP